MGGTVKERQEEHEGFQALRVIVIFRVKLKQRDWVSVASR